VRCRAEPNGSEPDPGTTRPGLRLGDEGPAGTSR
jgi:hypothetical protein